HPPVTDKEQARIDEPPQTPSPKAESPPPMPVARRAAVTDMSPVALPMLAPPASPKIETVVEAAPPPAPAPSINDAVTDPPPSRSDHSRVLPSVIVDVASEYVGLVERVLQAGGDEDAEAELVRAGGYAMPAIMEQFPGPVTIETDRLEQGVLPRVADCGPII